MLKSLLQLALIFEQFVELRVGGIDNAQLVVAGIKLLLKGEGVGKSGFRLFDKGASGREGVYLLRQVADGGAFGLCYHAGVAFDATGHDFDQGGFAGAVDPHQADAFLAVQSHVDLLEQVLVAELDVEIVDGEHGCSCKIAEWIRRLP